VYTAQLINFSETTMAVWGVTLSFYTVKCLSEYPSGEGSLQFVTLDGTYFKPGTVKCLSEDPSPEGGVITLCDTWPSELVLNLRPQGGLKFSTERHLMLYYFNPV